MRLTRWIDGYLCVDSPNQGNVIKKLAAYEDTGFEPDEIDFCLSGAISPQEAKERYEAHKKRYDEWLAWKQAEEQGLLIRLPCKVGDTFFFLSETIHGELYVAQSRVSNIIMAGDALMIVDTDGCYHCAYWFTRAEAEAALKGEKEDDD